MFNENFQSGIRKNQKNQSSENKSEQQNEPTNCSKEESENPKKNKQMGLFIFSKKKKPKTNKNVETHFMRQMTNKKRCVEMENERIKNENPQKQTENYFMEKWNNKFQQLKIVFGGHLKKCQSFLEK